MPDDRPQINVRLDQSLKDEFGALAAHNHRSVSDELRKMIQEAVDAHKAAQAAEAEGEHVH